MLSTVANSDGAASVSALASGPACPVSSYQTLGASSFQVVQLPFAVGRQKGWMLPAWHGRHSWPHRLYLSAWLRLL